MQNKPGWRARMFGWFIEMVSLLDDSFGNPRTENLFQRAESGSNLTTMERWLRLMRMMWRKLILLLLIDWKTWRS